MVGAPGYSTDRAVLILTTSPKSVVRSSDVATLWAVFEEAGILTTFAATDSGSLRCLADKESAVDLPDEARRRLEKCVNLSRARCFKGVSYDAVVILGEDPEEYDTSGLGPETLMKPSRVADIVMGAVKGNKCVATSGTAILSLVPAVFKGQPLLRGRSFAVTENVAAAIESCDVTHFAFSGHEEGKGDDKVADPVGNFETKVSSFVRDRRLFTTARPKGLEEMCKALRGVILSKEFESTVIPAYLY